MTILRLIGNVLWLVLAGWWLALGYLLAGVIACVFIITIPFGVASFRLAGYALWPFGRTIVERPDAGVASALGNVIWFLVAGWWLALGHLAAAVGWFLTIIGIPFGIVTLKMAVLALLPLGREVVRADSV